MSVNGIGVDIDDFRLSPTEALKRAADLRFRVVEVATVAGELAAWNLSPSGRRHLLRYASGLGLRMGALTADLPGLHLTDPSSVDERVSSTLKIIDLARDVNVPIVTASVGALTDPATGEPLPTAMEALSRIGEFADSRGGVYGLRPSVDTTEQLATVLDHLGCPAIKVCLDPAMMVMNGINPLASFEKLAEHISLCHARDATVGSSTRSGQETRLSEGEVDLTGMLALLDTADYGGDYIVRRTDSQTPIDDIAQGRDVLESILPPTA